MGKITFLIACYNQLSYTKSCVRSILDNSPHGTYNFVFVDNGSTDGTRDYLPTVPDSHIITNQENNYVNPAWNQGFEFILNNNIGDYICLCNNDIVAGTGWLSPILNAFETRLSELYIPTSNTQLYIPTSNTHPFTAFHHHHELEQYTRTLQDKPLKFTPVIHPFVGFCMFFRKKHIEYFYPIPHELKILRGDDWIVDNLFHRSVVPMLVSHCAVYHFISVTQRSLSIGNITSSDANLFNRICDTEYKKRKMGRIGDQYRVSMI